MSKTFDTNPEMELLCLHIFKKSNGNIEKRIITNEHIDIIKQKEKEE